MLMFLVTMYMNHMIHTIYTFMQPDILEYIDGLST